MCRSRINVVVIGCAVSITCSAGIADPWADEVADTNGRVSRPENGLGAPDGYGNNFYQSYAELWHDAHITYEFTGDGIVDRPGDDLYIYLLPKSSHERGFVLASSDGQAFQQLGEFYDGYTRFVSFDLSTVGLASARYIRIADDPADLIDNGPDIDAVGTSYSGGIRPHSSFDTGHEGWEVVTYRDPENNGYSNGDYYPLTWSNSGGNPGGWVQDVDPDAQTWYFTAPPIFLGDRSAQYGSTLEFDLVWLNPTTPAADIGQVVLQSDSLVLVHPRVVVPADDWTHVQIPLIEGAWRIDRLSGPMATEQDVRDVLGNLKQLLIYGEYSTSGLVEQVGLDGVGFGDTCDALTVSGACPGFTVINYCCAVPGDRLAVVYGIGSGSAEALPFCPGLFMDIRRPTVAGSGYADANGCIELLGYVPDSGCGRVLVQGVNLTSCTKSEVVLIQ